MYVSNDGLIVERLMRFSKHLEMVTGSFNNPLNDELTVKTKCAHIEFLKSYRKGFMTPEFWDYLIVLLQAEK